MLRLLEPQACEREAAPAPEVKDAAITSWTCGNLAVKSRVNFELIRPKNGDREIDGVDGSTRYRLTVLGRSDRTLGNVSGQSQT